MKEGYERDFLRYLQSLLAEVERRIRRGHARLALSQAQQNAGVSALGWKYCGIIHAYPYRAFGIHTFISCHQTLRRTSSAFKGNTCAFWLNCGFYFSRVLVPQERMKRRRRFSQRRLKTWLYRFVTDMMNELIGVKIPSSDCSTAGNASKENFETRLYEMTFTMTSSYIVLDVSEMETSEIGMHCGKMPALILFHLDWGAGVWRPCGGGPGNDEAGGAAEGGEGAAELHPLGESVNSRLMYLQSPLMWFYLATNTFFWKNKSN